MDEQAKRDWYAGVLRRFNEAIALDYLLFFKVIYPPADE